MAKNGAKGGSRIGAVSKRSQVKLPNGGYAKRNTTTGRFMDVSKNPFKGVRREK